MTEQSLVRRLLPWLVLEVITTVPLAVGLYITMVGDGGELGLALLIVGAVGSLVGFAMVAKIVLANRTTHQA